MPRALCMSAIGNTFCCCCTKGVPGIAKELQERKLLSSGDEQFVQPK